MENKRKVSRADLESYNLEILLRRPSLRTNISRRVSQVQRELTQETTCGLGCIRGEWLQSFANRRAYIFIYGVLGSIYGSCYTYFYGTISTLEKRFRFSSQTMGLLAATSDIIQIILCLVLFSCKPKIHKPRWIGFSIFITIVSTIISSIPYFLYGVGDEWMRGKQGNNAYPNETWKISACLEENDSCSYKQREESMTLLILSLAQILHGLGGGLFFALGRAYRNENLKHYHAPALLSLLAILKTLGPAFGFWLSSMCLKIFVSPALVPGINEHNPKWIGAWWLGNLVLGFMLMIPASLIILFPKTLLKTAVKRDFSDIKAKEQVVDTETEKTAAMKNLLMNPTYTCNNFSGVFNVLGFVAYYIFLPKYAEIQFHISASNTNLIIGSVTIIFSALGIVVASSLISRYKPSTRPLAASNVIVGLFSIASLIVYITLGCPQNEEQIKTMFSQISDNNLHNTCDCDNIKFSPVCNMIGETFISPCYTDCEKILYNNYTMVYSGCIKNEMDIVHPGSCTVDCDFNWVLFVITTCLTSFVYAGGRTSNFWFEMKSFEDGNQPQGIDLKMAFLSFVAFVPGPILFGYIMDDSCLLWDNSCSRGNCWLYDNEKLRYIMNIAAIGFVMIGVLFDMLMWFFGKDIELFEEEYEYDDAEE